MARFERCDRDGWEFAKGGIEELAGPACVRTEPTSRRIALAFEVWLGLCLVSFGVLLLPMDRGAY